MASEKTTPDAEQGGEFVPLTFVRDGEDGEKRERVAYSPAEEVQLRYDGWSEKKTGRSAPAATTSSSTAASKSGA